MAFVLQTSFLSNWGITAAEQADIPFLVNEKLFSHDKDQTITGSDDWFGEGVARPDLVLADLRAIVSPEEFPEHESIFFRNIALNEAITEAGPEACEGLECTSYATQEPLPISDAAEGIAEPSSAAAWSMLVAVVGAISAMAALM